MSTDTTPTRLSPTARTAFEGAAVHPDHRVELPVLPAAARNGVLRSMLRAGLVEEAEGEGEAAPTLRATALGLQAVAAQLASAAVLPEEEVPLAPEREGERAPLPTAAETAAVPSTALARRLPLRTAAEALLAAWDAQQGLGEAVEVLRLTLAQRGRPSPSTAHRHPRTDTKQAQVLALLGRTEGATIAQVIELTGWAPHTVRGFLAGLKRKAISVEMLERVRRVGAGKQGAKGSYSVYRIAAGEGG